MRFASRVFGMNVTKTTHPNQRFIGKTAILGLGYGCGVERFYQMVVTQARQYGIPLEDLFDRQVAQRTVDFYRHAFPRIKANWYLLDRHLAHFINVKNPDQETDWGPVTIRTGRIELPNHMFLRYEIGIAACTERSYWRTSCRRWRASW